MGLSLHHFFLLTEPGAPAADRLNELGLVEGSRNVHPGQGTANRRFFFQGAYLEFIHFVDEDEARSGPGSIFRSLDRYESDSGSPFGLVFKADAPEDLQAFPGFPYQPEYFDEGVFFTVGDNVDSLAEPNCFVLPILPPVPATEEPRSGPPFERVARLRVAIPATELSAPIAAIAAVEGLEIVTGKPHLMEILFGDTGSTCDLRPELPLVLCW